MKNTRHQRLQECPGAKLNQEAAEAPVIEIYAAVLGALLGVGGTGAIMTLSGSSRRNTESRETVIRLTTAVESIAGKLEELHIDIKEDRERIYTRLNEHGERITALEAKGAKIRA